MQQTINLVAGIRQRIERGGRFLMVLDTGAAANIEVWLFNGSQELEYMRTAERGTKLRLQDEHFTHAEMKASVNAACEIVVSNGLVDIDLFAGASVNATLVNPLPLPVSNDRGSPGNLMHVTGVSIADAPAVAASSNAPVACGPVAAVVAAADANRRAIRMCNLGPDPVSVGPAGLTWAQRVIVLDVGDVWIEDRGANLAWSAITDAGDTASVTWQGVTA